MRSRKASLRRARPKNPSPPATSTATAQPHWRTKALTASMATVSIGSARLELVKTLAICGTTQVTSTTTITRATVETMAG